MSGQDQENTDYEKEVTDPSVFRPLVNALTSYFFLRCYREVLIPCHRIITQFCNDLTFGRIAGMTNLPVVKTAHSNTEENRKNTNGRPRF